MTFKYIPYLSGGGDYRHINTNQYQAPTDGQLAERLKYYGDYFRREAEVAHSIQQYTLTDSTGASLPPADAKKPLKCESLYNHTCSGPVARIRFWNKEREGVKGHWSPKIYCMCQTAIDRHKVDGHQMISEEEADHAGLPPMAEPKIIHLPTYFCVDAIPPDMLRTLLVEVNNPTPTVQYVPYVVSFEEQQAWKRHEAYYVRMLSKGLYPFKDMGRECQPFWKFGTNHCVNAKRLGKPNKQRCTLCGGMVFERFKQIELPPPGVLI
jgi:hypothetical protein